MAVTIQGSGQLPVQIVQTVVTTPVSTASTSFIDITGMTATITPKSASNKILVLVDGKFSASSASAGIFIKLQRNGSDIYVGTSVGSSVACSFGFMPNGANVFYYGQTPMTQQFLDSPATTSAVTYKLQWYAYSGGTGYLNQSGYDGTAYNPRTASSITLMEVAYA